MLKIAFSGWIQVRLATDPDPFDEPRGVSGYVRALPGEPDFDRVVRLHSPQAHRTHAPAVGVMVTSAQLESTQIEIPALHGARVDLLDDPKFEGRNGIIAEDVLEPILPFHLAIDGGGLSLRRKLGGKYDHPFRELWGAGTAFNTDDWQRILGTDDPALLLRRRRELLAEERASAIDPLHQAQLDQRIAFLSDSSHADRFRWGMRWRYELAGAFHWEDKNGIVNGGGDGGVPWRADFRIGIWDADTLCAWMDGVVLIPLCPEQSIG